MKKVLFITGVEVGKRTNCKAAYADMSFEMLCKVDGDFRTSAQLKAMFDNSRIEFVMILLYKANGELKRRMAGTDLLPQNDDEIKQCVEMILDTVEIKAERIFVDKKGGKDV